MLGGLAEFERELIRAPRRAVPLRRTVAGGVLGREAVARCAESGLTTGRRTGKFVPVTGRPGPQAHPKCFPGATNHDEPSMPSELLKHLMEQARDARLVLPDFQRDFVWKPTDVIKLLSSLLNGYPIGGLLVMENPGMYGQRPLDGVIGGKASGANGEARLILDGQQRLTSCYRAFFNNMGVDRYPGRYYFKYCMFLDNPRLPNSQVEELIYFAREKEVKHTLPDTASEQAKGYFPLDSILQEPPPRGTNYSKWLSDYTFSKAAGSREVHDKLSQLQSDFILRFIEKITGYQVHFEEIKKDTPSDVICTVFETINTTGKRLTVFDLLVARCFPDKMNLREMLEAALDRKSIKLFDPEGEGIAPIALPRIIALKEKETARRGDILELPPAIIKKHWGYAVDALEKALQVLMDRYGCFGQRFVPLEDMIAPMAVIIASDKFRDTNEQLRMLDKWWWRSVFSQYYISAAETKMQRTVRQWLSREGENVGWLDNPNNEPDSVRDFTFRTSIVDDVSRIDNAVYRGVFSLLLSRRVRDFSTNRKTLVDVPWEEIEDHHIYPKQFLGPFGIKGNKVNNVANRTPLTRSTNGAIGKTAPHVYLADFKIVGREPVNPVLLEHLIDPQLVLRPFTAELYNQFLADRTKKIVVAIGDAVDAVPLVDVD